MTPLRWVALGIGVLLLAVLGFVAWVLNTPSGAVWAASTATRMLSGKLALREVRGTIAGPLTVNGLRYRDPDSGLDVQVEQATVDVELSELLARRVHVRDMAIDGLIVQLSKRKKPPEEPSEPASLRPPIDVVVDRFGLRQAAISREGKVILEATRALLVGSWTGDGIGIRQLELESPQGRVDISGAVARENGYVGKANGRFRWRFGKLEYAGALDLNSDAREAKLEARLTSPVGGKLSATLQQQESLPWRMEVQVPTFDPREKLMPGSSLQSLAAALRGHGDRSRADIRGDVSVNGARVFIDPLRATLYDRVIDIEAFTLRDAARRGVLKVDGKVRLDEDPFLADVVASWRDVEVPEQLAGQKLASRGRLAVRGNTSRFHTAGELSVGPPGQLADIDLIADGSPEELLLQRLSIVQQNGDLTANGRIGFKPHVAWRIAAAATRFDPGAFVASWPGQLGFKLDSEGQLRPEGPSGSLRLDGLTGTLRNRPIAGDADLTLTPNRTVAGTMRLRSGGSTVRLNGAHGEALDLDATFSVPSLDDWVPDARGRLNGRLSATGHWPGIRVSGSVRGRGLGMNEMGLQGFDLSLDVTEPLHPRGSVHAQVRQLTSAGFELKTIELDADGTEADHTVELSATGTPLGAQLRVQGRRLENGWSGSVQSLVLAVPDVERLVLRQPAQISVTGSAFSVSDSCLENSQLSVCVAAERTEENELQGRYVIEHLPLALITALTKPDLPFAVAGVIEGRGEVRRAPDGALFGSASLTSPQGSVAEKDSEDDPLLAYQNLQVQADLRGDTASASAQMAFSDGGELRGDVTIGDLRGVTPTVQGQGRASIRDLSPIGLFVSQLADIRGQAEANMTVDGTLDAPRLAGGARVQGFATELPLLGLQLREGEIEATADDDGQIRIAGRITSGDGRLNIDGGAQSLGDIHLTARGENFMAANIPGARVVVTPELDFRRSEQRMDLTGKVAVPRADIDASKLPAVNQGQRVSPDVVVIDDPTPDETARRLPLYTKVTVTLGERVTLVGFGLNAKLGGQLVVLETPDSDPLGSGEITVEGNYKAYGQDLTIQRGRLLYANTPLNNPQIDLVAVREIEGEDVTAKLTVRGSALRPVLEVSSEPSMSQMEALSYLVTGKGLNQLGKGEGDVVQSAARSLGTAAGNLLAKNLGRRLGVDEIGIQNSAEIGGSAFTIGEYLSPRLYVSYGVGLFEPGQIVTLRYRLSSKVSVEASQGPLQQRAGIHYRIEK